MNEQHAIQIINQFIDDINKGVMPRLFINPISEAEMVEIIPLLEVIGLMKFSLMKVDSEEKHQIWEAIQSEIQKTGD